MQASFYQFSYQDLQGLLSEQGFESQNARHLFNWFYKKNSEEFYSRQNLPKRLLSWLQENFRFDLPEIAHVHFSEDKTVKFLFRLNDGSTVESVLIPFQDKYTLCLSSQVGCQMNCSFCFTGKQGLKRHLEVEEILGQLLQAKRWLKAHRPDDCRLLNVVFMGQGEPLHNFDHVKKATEILISQHGLSMADHKITVSTSGYLPGLKRWVEEMPNVNLALSLHSAFSEKRSQIIPLNRKYSLEQLLELIDQIPLGKKRFITYEYLLIRDFNDQEEDAHELAKLLKDRQAILNLIPFNPFPGTPYQRPTEEAVEKFKNLMENSLPNVTLRKTKGDEILAACGQLNTKTSPLLSHNS